jgi:hypothetical protein
MKTPQSDMILEEVYEALLSDKVHNFDHMHIPRSDVFYARNAYYNYSGEWVDLDRMERCMFLEGMLEARDVKDPKRKRDWE